MKRLAALVSSAVFIFVLTGCKPDYDVSYSDIGYLEVTAIVTAFEDYVISYDEVELVYEGSDRAKELGLRDMENGYVIYDPDTELKTAEMAPNISFYLQRWDEEKQAFDTVGVLGKDFHEEMESRSPDGILCGLKLLGKIVEVKEIVPQ